MNLDRQAILQNDIKLMLQLSEQAIQDSDRILQTLSDISYTKKSSLLFRIFWKKQALTYQSFKS